MDFVRWRGLSFAVGVALAASASIGFWISSEPGADPDRLLARAKADFEAGRRDRASRELDRLARLREPTAEVRLLRAQIEISAGRIDRALELFAQIPDDDQTGAIARLRAGQLELRRDRTVPAEAHFLKALAIEPRLVQARRELIYIYGMQLRRRELAEQFRALSHQVQLTYDDIFLWCLTRGTVWEPEESSQQLAKFVAADPGDRGSRLGLAEDLRRLGKLGEALEALAPLPESDPDARATRARLALDRNDDTGLATLLAEGPTDHAELARLRGRLAQARRDPAAALVHYRAASAVDPDDRDALFGLGQALRASGDTQAAEAPLAAAKRLDELAGLVQRAGTNGGRNDPRLLRSLGAACEAVGRRDEARAWLGLAIARDPLDSAAQAAMFRLGPVPPPPG